MNKKNVNYVINHKKEYRYIPLFSIIAQGIFLCQVIKRTVIQEFV